MKNIILLILFILPLTTFAENRIKIAVIDTGVSHLMSQEKFMCKGKPVSTAHNSPYDDHGHGTNVIGIIGQEIDPKTHCIVSIKFYNKLHSNVQTVKSTVKALKLVLADRSIRYLNLSLGGGQSYSIEKKYIRRLLIRGVTITAAAGNEGKSLDTEQGKYYPASYRETLKFPNFRVVGSKLPSSNYGKIVTDVRSGDRVKPNFWYARRLSGTSQAAAQKMAEIIRNVVLYNTGDINGQQKVDKRGKCYR